MADQRPISPFETKFFDTDTKFGSVPTGAMPLFIGSTVHGTLDAGLLRRVLGDLAAAHPSLRSRVATDAEGTSYLRPDDGFRPALDEMVGGEAEYLKLVNGPREWRGGLFRAYLLRDTDRDQLVVVIHHGICDGRSAFALLDELWRRYTAAIAGSPLRQTNSVQQLPEAIDTQLASVVTDAEVTAWLDEIRAAVATMGPESAPRRLPEDGVGDDPLGRFALQRIELDAKETAVFVNAARKYELSVNSLLTGAALIAVRSQLEPGSGPLPLLCGYAVDLRSQLNPQLPVDLMLNCASGAGTLAVVAVDANPADVGRLVAAAMRAVLDQGEPAKVLLASNRVLDDVMAAVLSGQPTIAMSNVGRLPAHSMPEGIRLIRDDVYAMGPGMPPKFTVFTVGDRMTIQVEYDTAHHSRAQMGKVGLALIEQIRRT
ncbi:MAG: hypothetical protein JWN03_9051 [Nocardia sp.]|uniref:phthiocerol/phthiodiolone dimycocerosyl transferase family protein n=1 Tax=Nocardia sp. TaxID=1821 RepID=UPI00262CFE39|nr:condensation domain-containing protein [Nocardia sp.]MCU1648776.1 hypothetical protein [Nocardia sp.]